MTFTAKQKIDVLIKNGKFVLFDSEDAPSNTDIDHDQALNILLKLPADSLQYEVDLVTYIGVAERVFLHTDKTILVKPVPDGVFEGDAAFFQWDAGQAGFLPANITSFILENDGAEVANVTISASGNGSAALPVIVTPVGGVPRLAVADIDDPSAELASQDGDTGDGLLVYEDQDPAQATFYIFDESVTAADNAPYIVSGTGGKWIAFAGKYVNSTINGRNLAADGSALDSHIANVSNPHGVTTAQIGAIPTSEKGVAGGVATLDGTGKVPLSQLTINSGLSYQGLWDANANSPALSSGVGTENDYYIVGTAGTTNLDGETDWQPKDWVLFNGGAWVKVDNSESVASVAGKTGVVTLDKNDVGLSNVDNTSDANKPVSTAQAAADAAVQAFAIDRANHTGTQAVGTIDGGPANSFIVSDAAGVLSPNAFFGYDPANFNGANWIHTVNPLATTDFKKLHNTFTNANPQVAGSQENWFAHWIQANVGSDDSGNQLGDSGGGGLTGLGVSVSSVNQSDFGYLRAVQAPMEIGNGTDPIVGSNAYLFDSYISMHSGVTLDTMYGVTLSFSSDGGTVANCRPINVGGSLADITGQYQGLQITPNLTFSGGAGNFAGATIGGNGTGFNNAVGLQINMAGYTGGTNDPVGIDSNGRTNLFWVGSPVDGGGNPQNFHNVTGGVQATATTANADTISLGMTQIVQVDPGVSLTSGPFQLGVSSMTMAILPTIGAGGSIDYIAGATAALNLQGASGAGTISEFRSFRSALIPDGFTTITRSRGFFHHEPFGVVATTSWGMYILDSENNYIQNGLRIGGTPGSSDTVTNTSIGLDMATRAIKLANLTTAERDALTAVNGMLIYNTSTNKFQGYENGSWTDLI